MARKTTVNSPKPKTQGNGAAHGKKDDAPVSHLPSASRPIILRGVRTHNLKNISLELPRNKFIVVTGVSGSGKSSLAFDTIYAEGQRRFVESLSAYVRQFLDRMPKPDVDFTSGIAPAVAIEQAPPPRNPRSTVGTSTEIYDYLRVLFARLGQTICINDGNLVRRDTTHSTLAELTKEKDGTKMFVLFPLHIHKDHSLSEEIDNLRKQGFTRVVLKDSNEIIDIAEKYSLPTKKKEDIRVLVDRLVWRSDDSAHGRVADALETAFREGNGYAIIRFIDRGEEKNFSEHFECSQCGARYEEPEPRLFSFNNPFGACPECQGFGRSVGIDMTLVIPNGNKTLKQGAIAPWTSATFSPWWRELLALAREAKLRTDVSYAKLTDEEKKIVIEGYKTFKGVNGFFRMLEEKSYKMHYRILHSRYRGYTTCLKCHGSRLRPVALAVRVRGKSIDDLINMTIIELKKFFDTLVFTETEVAIGKRVFEEIKKRLRYLEDVGVGYLTLNRLSNTLSGGEAQRINLAAALGSALVGALYVLDEPSIGLHARDSDRLTNTLIALRNLGNTVIVVEHDPAMMERADVIVDMGPEAGERGGEILFVGSREKLLQEGKTLTAQYLNGSLAIPIPKTRRKGRGMLRVIGAYENNLKGVDCDFPLHTFTVVTGVSGSGKSTLIHEILAEGIRKMKFDHTTKAAKVEFIEGVNLISAVEIVDQTPIGRSPRSNPATYIGVFDSIRETFARTEFAKAHNWPAGYFSFNVPGGRCETCEGEGFQKVEMQFMADLYLECEACHGNRFKKETLDAHYKGKSVVDVLAMSATQARKFFDGVPRIARKLDALVEVGLGYIKIGQPATTLSGGEAQRMKLALHLAERKTDPTLFIFDEPTTGLHFADIAVLVKCFDALVDAGHSVIVIEHNLEVIKCADYVIDLGPDAGEDGGEIVATGTPEEIVNVAASHTGNYLKNYLKKKSRSL